MERVGRKTVLPAKAIRFIGWRKTEGMPEGPEEDKAGVAVELSKNSNKEENESPMPYRHLGKSKYQRERRKS